MADRVVLVATLLAATVAALATLGSLDWRLELLTHFRLHAALGAGLLLIYWIVRRRGGLALLAAAVVAVNALPMRAYVLPASPAAQAGPLQLRLLSANVGLRNEDYDALARLVAEEQPDVVGLLEVDRRWIAGLSALRRDYPHVILMPEEGPYGLALYSRWPLAPLAGSSYREDGVRTAISASIETQGRRVALTLAHLMAPLSGRKAALRDRQIRKLAADLAQATEMERILIGDLNTTPWSPGYRPLETVAGLGNAAQRRGYHATWPAALGYFGLPIDHCLVSGGLAVARFRTGRDIGSDHRPILVDIVMRPPAPGEGGPSR